MWAARTGFVVGVGVAAFAAVLTHWAAARADQHRH
jgi:hypothetical protein